MVQSSFYQNGANYEAVEADAGGAEDAAAAAAASAAAAAASAAEAAGKVSKSGDTMTGALGIGIAPAADYILETLGATLFYDNFAASDIAGTVHNRQQDFVNLSLDADAAGGAVLARFSSVLTVGAGNLTAGGHSVGAKGSAVHNGTGTLAMAVGVEGTVSTLSTGPISDAIAIMGYFGGNALGATINNYYAFHALSSQTNSGTINQWVDFYSPDLGAGAGTGTIGSRYSLLNEDADKLITTSGLVEVSNGTDARALTATRVRVIDGHTPAFGSVTTQLTPSLYVSRIEDILDTGASDGAYGPAILGNTLAYGTQQGVGITGSAHTVADSDCDVVGIYGTAQQNGTNVRNAFGGFFSAQSNVPGGYAFGTEVAVYNDTGTDASYANITPYPRTAGTHIISLGANRNATGIWIGSHDGSGPKFDVGVALTTTSVLTTGFQDDSSSVNVMKATAAHTNGIDLSGATFSGSAFTSPGFAVSGAGAVASGAVAATGNVTASGFVLAGSATPSGTFYFGSTASAYVNWDGSRFDVGGGNFHVVGAVVTTPLAVGSLPAAAASLAGARRFVTDANATTFASIVAAGGANGVPVYCDGTNWRIG